VLNYLDIGRYKTILAISVALCVCSPVVQASNLPSENITNPTSKANSYTKWESRYVTDSIGSKKSIEIKATRKVIIDGKSRNVTSKLLDYKPPKGTLGKLFGRRLMMGAAGVGVPIVLAVLYRHGYMLDKDTNTYVKNENNKWRWSCNGQWYTNPTSMYPCLAANKKRLLEAGTDYTYTINITGHSIDDRGMLRYFYTSSRILNGETISSSNTDLAIGSSNPNPSPSSETLTDEKLDDILNQELNNPQPNTDMDGLVNSLSPNIELGESVNDSPIFKDIQRELEKNEKYEKLPEDTAITSETTQNPDGSSKTQSELPEFCNYAAKLCDWLNWTQEEPQEKESEPTEPEEEKLDDLLDQMHVSYIKGRGYCPQDNQIPIDIAGLHSNITLSYQPFCSLATQARPAVILIAWVVAAFIVTGTSRKASED